MLIDLLNRLAVDFEYETNSTAASRAKTLAYINAASRELWNGNDLPGSLMEQAFTMDRSLNQVSLPWYVHSIRGMRRRLTGMKITMHDMRPRYYASPWMQPYNNFRIKRRTPLLRPLTAESQLTATITTAETDAVSITFIGQTTTANKARQTVTLAAGALTGTTSLQFTTEAPFGMIGISKDTRTSSDVTITDATNTIVATIPATETRATNTIVMLTDIANPSYNPEDTVECLFKLPCEELFYDEDLFAGSQALEDAVYWMARYYYHSSSVVENMASVAAIEKANALDIAESVINNDESEAEHPIEVAPNRFSGVWAGPQATFVPGLNDYLQP